ncbi:hypothetical protein DH86_00001790 [Scytalidium sp. 3C]|nr:hypothetical protein DH86_00001790 [Scytalidium sp. 3C]
MVAGLNTWDGYIMRKLESPTKLHLGPLVLWEQLNRCNLNCWIIWIGVLLEYMYMSTDMASV